MAKPWSFRYPYEILTTMLPWKKTLDASSLIGGASGNYDQVIKFLTDRDRALEDHLNLGVAQGYVALTYLPTGTITLSGAGFADIAGLAVTFTVPANRKILVTAGVRTIATSAGAPGSQVRLLDENNNVLGLDYYNYGPIGGAASVHTYLFNTFYSPLPGTHTIRAQGQYFAGLTVAVETLLTTFGTSNTFISIQDVGPSDRL